MADDYLVELKDSIFRETPLEETDFDGDRRIAFASKTLRQIRPSRQHLLSFADEHFAAPCIGCRLELIIYKFLLPVIFIAGTCVC